MGERRREKAASQRRRSQRDVTVVGDEGAHQLILQQESASLDLSSCGKALVNGHEVDVVTFDGLMLRDEVWRFQDGHSELLPSCAESRVNKRSCSISTSC